MNSIKLGKKIVDDNSLYFIADIGANHNGSLEKAIKLIHLAKEAGADAAKFQNFQANKIVSKKGFDAIKSASSHQSKWKKSVYEVYEDASISMDWTETLYKTCKEVGIEYFTSPYDIESVNVVDPFVELYKIGSGDVTWLEIIDYILDKKKPILIATGASSELDVERVMDFVLRKTEDVVLMQCNTNYTGSLDNFNYCNLKVLQGFKEKYPNIVLGLSDHTPGHATVLGSIAYGARVIEKHFTDDNNQDGPDHKFAMNPQSWREMVERSKELLVALGDGKKVVEDNELDAQVVQRRCIRTNKDLKIGDRVRHEDLMMLRPMEKDCFQPFDSESLIGKLVKEEIFSGDHLSTKNIKL